LFNDLPIDPKLTRAFSPFFGVKVHFLFETTRDLGLQGFQMARVKLSWFDCHEYSPQFLAYVTFVTQHARCRKETGSKKCGGRSTQSRVLLTLER
jgi:hypothetical protein